MISIIVPIYNVEKYLRKCIESIIGQTYKNLQIILIDDGSPDGCPQICDEYAERDNRIVVIHQENKGVSAARNAGLKIATGTYIGFVDPDDYLAPEMYEKMVDAMGNEKAQLVICGYDYVEEDGKVSWSYVIKENEILSQRQYVSMQFDMPPTVRHGVVNKLFERERINRNKFPNHLKSSEDVYFVSDYIKNIEKVVFVHQPLYKNLVRQGSATHGGLKIESLSASFQAHKKMHEEAIHMYPELKNRSLAFLLDVCLLKYNEAKRQYKLAGAQNQKQYVSIMKRMKIFIKRYALQAAFNKEIYWKTRIAYFLIK